MLREKSIRVIERLISIKKYIVFLGHKISNLYSGVNYINERINDIKISNSNRYITNSMQINIVMIIIYNLRSKAWSNYKSRRCIIFWINIMRLNYYILFNFPSEKYYLIITWENTLIDYKKTVTVITRQYK